MKKGFRKCPKCDGVAEGQERCHECYGPGVIPLIPPVAETVVYREPLSQWELDELKAGRFTKQDLIERLVPLVVLRADKASSGSHPWIVRVTGWVLRFGQDERTKNATLKYYVDEGKGRYVPGLGWVMPHDNGDLPVEFKREIPGPSNEPGCWRWKGDPR